MEIKAFRGLRSNVAGQRTALARRSRAVRACIGACLASALVGCLFSNSGSPTHPEPGYAGLRMLPSKGRTFHQGSGEEGAGPQETPLLATGFTYAYWMDTVEVTQSHFGRLMGREPVSPSSAYGHGDDFPVYSVTWFDAALFCNARSRLAGMDTVYAYARAVRGEDGRVLALEGLSIRLDRVGYRLPTEAEWEYAARGGSQSEFPWGGLRDSGAAGEYAWYSGNAGNTAHPVATRKPNAFGLYDMAGNVMEWVNDWKGIYPGTGTLDFAGARDPGAASEKPLKSGAFSYGLRELRPANRSATYPAIPSSATEYVGFRCALGAVSNPRFSSSDGQWLDTDPVALAITRLQSYLSGHAAKLVFVNMAGSRRNLVYVDYGGASARMLEFSDAREVFHPTISPDGNWVAYGTRPEGAREGSQLYLRKLDGTPDAPIPAGPGFIPRWWADPVSRDTFLVFTSSAVSNRDPGWSSTRTLLMKIQGGNPVGAAQVLTGEGSYHDGRSRDGRYLATGFTNLRTLDLSNGERRVLFTAPQNGKNEGDTSQVCNVSMAPDATGRTLFLDFGSPTINRLTGTGYGIHELAFLADAQGMVAKWYRAPREEVGWEHLEWSNHKDFAVAAGRDASGQTRRLYLVNLKDSIYTRLAVGTALQHPSLWVNPASLPPGSGENLALDSLALYDSPEGVFEQKLFSDKMVRFWRFHKEWELVFLGSSHVECGIDPHRFTRLRAFNMGISAMGWLGSQTMARDYVLNHCPKLKVLVLEVVAGWMILPGGDLFWKDNMAKTRGFRYDLAHGFWKEGLPRDHADLVRLAPNYVYPLTDSAGFIEYAAAGWGLPPLPMVNRNDWSVENPQYRENFESIQAFARLVADRKIHLLLVN